MIEAIPPRGNKYLPDILVRPDQHMDRASPCTEVLLRELSTSGCQKTGVLHMTNAPKLATTPSTAQDF
jgi:hypothetical protein